MNRRNLFKLIGGALCAAAMDLTGVKPAVAKLTDEEWFIRNLNAAVAKIMETGEWKGALREVSLRESHQDNTPPGSML